MKNRQFWAITTFFNPTNSARRLENYRSFRSALCIPLITVEWSWTNGPDFMLGSKEAEILIRKKSKDLLWQKERLLNIAIKVLPKDCLYVAWLDCDVLFDNPNWANIAAEKLEQFQIIQPYSALINLDSKGEIPADSRKHIRRPIGNREVFSSLEKDALRHEFKGEGAACGYAWAATSALLGKHGLYDSSIIGSGDRAIFCAAMGHFPEAGAYLRMNRNRYEHYLRWAKPFFEDIVGQVGSIDGQIRNLWHGSMQNRQYESRHIKLEEFDFDPDKDIQIDDSGCWTWKTSKPKMHKLLVDYFFSRHEDDAQ